MATRWPHDKVSVFTKTTVTRVRGNEVTLSEVEYNYSNQTYKVEEEEEEDATIVLKNIDTVIFCTGYNPNFDMLDENLRPFPIKNDRCNPVTKKIAIPPDWKMHPAEEDGVAEYSESESDSSSGDDDDDSDDDSSSCWAENENEQISYNNKLSQLIFGDDYKKIENGVSPPLEGFGRTIPSGCTTTHCTGGPF